MKLFPTGLLARVVESALGSITSRMSVTPNQRIRLAAASPPRLGTTWADISTYLCAPHSLYASPMCRDVAGRKRTESWDDKQTGANYTDLVISSMSTIEFLDANVLAHEVEHVDHYHCLERVQIGRLDEAYQG